MNESTLKTPMAKPQYFGLAQHKFRQFDLVVPADTKKEDIMHPKFWGLVAPQLQMGSEVRVLADDFSFRALVLVAYAQGTVVRVQMVDYTNFPIMVTEEVREDYKVVLRGAKKFCIVKMDTGEAIKEDIPTKAEAYTELDQFLKALAA